MVDWVVAVSDSSDLRKRLRRQAIAAREAIKPTDRAEWTARIERHLDHLLPRLAPTRLAFCWPHRGEVDLAGWVRRWLLAHPARQAALPVVNALATPMIFHRWHPETPLQTDRYGIPIPAVAEEVHPDVLLIPLNAFDDNGYRLGYGGGYFDRTLAALDPKPVAVGIAFELGHHPQLYPQPHDLPMDWIVTEATVRGPLGPIAKR
ncbi:MAG: 5-formyltetrahydrofolate cyclo-ligase [Zoogloeaceae bacterium]|nr:5-formyltetrahydrofolate cyclo-ligase [Zoogloeaceae bacterium]